MPRLSAVPGLAGGLLTLAAAAWWLSSLGLEARAGFGGAAALSADLAVIVVIAQWLLVVLLTTADDDTPPMRLGDRLAAVPACLAPAWPLLMLLWLTSHLSAAVLALSQVLAVAIGAGMTLAAAAIRRIPIGDGFRRQLSLAAGLAVAAGIWLARARIEAWVQA